MTDESDPEDQSTFLSSFSSDGIYQEVDPDGTAGIGAWEATGANTATLTFILLFLDDEEGGGSTVRASIEVAPDGQTLTAQFTIQFIGEECPKGNSVPPPRPAPASRSSRWGHRQARWKTSSLAYPREPT